MTAMRFHMVQEREGAINLQRWLRDEQLYGGVRNAIVEMCTTPIYMTHGTALTVAHIQSKNGANVQCYSIHLSIKGSGTSVASSPGPIANFFVHVGKKTDKDFSNICKK